MMVKLASTTRLRLIEHDAKIIMAVPDNLLPANILDGGWHVMVGVEDVLPGRVQTRWLVQVDGLSEPVEAFMELDDHDLNELPEVDSVFLRDDIKRWLASEGIVHECVTCNTVIPVLQQIIADTQAEVRSLAKLRSNDND